MEKPQKTLDVGRLGAALFEQAPFSVSVIDRDFRIVAANPYFEVTYGAWKGNHCYEVFKRQHRPCAECVASKTFSDGEVHVTEERGVNRAGAPTAVEMKTVPICGPGGQVDYVMETAVDISRVRDLERQYKLLFERVPCYITVLDRNLSIVDSNWRHREAFGDVLGQQCHEVYMRSDQICGTCPVLETLDDGRVHVEQRKVVDKKGGTVHFIVHSAPVYDRFGNITHAIEMSTDITTTIQMQEKLVEAETGAAMDRAMNMIALTTRQLLSGLDEGIAMVGEGLEAMEAPVLTRARDWIQARADHLTAMLRVIERYGVGSVPRQEVEPEALVERATRVFSSRPNQWRISVRSDVAADLPAVSVDAATVEDCLTCLISSFIEVCVPRDRIAESLHVLVRARPKAGGVVIDMSHRGMSALTDDDTTAGEAKGLSMSLLAVQRTLEKQGGGVSFIARAGQGITFEVTLPVSDRRR